MVQQLRETIPSTLVERFLNEYIPRGYTGNFAVECGTPRSERSHPLAHILTYYRGGEWHVLTSRFAPVEVYQIVEVSNKRRIDIDIDPIVEQFVLRVNELHNERPGYWCGDVRFGEARQALEEGQRQEQLEALERRREEIQAWREKHEHQEDKAVSGRYTHTLYLSTTRVLMQKVQLRSRTSISSKQLAERAMKLARENCWKPSRQSPIEIYDEQGRTVAFNEA